MIFGFTTPERRVRDRMMIQPEGESSRPTDPGQDNPGANDVHYNVDEAEPHCSENFCVHYVESGDHAVDDTDNGGERGVPDFVEQASRDLEATYAYQRRLGWNQIVGDGEEGGDERSDTYLAALGPDNGFGYANSEGDEGSGFLVLDNDYAREEYPGFTPRTALRTTIAHEFNHVLQFTYTANYESWAFESIASWMETRQYPEDHSAIGLQGFAMGTERPLTSGDPSETDKIYGSFLWSLFLDKRLGPEVIRGVWERADETDDNPAEAFDRSIRAAGGGGFARQWGAFSAAVSEYRAANAGFQPEVAAHRDAPDIERVGTLRRGQAIEGTLDHLTFALYHVPRGGGTASVRATLPRGVTGAVALVGRTGSARGGRVTVEVTQMPEGGNGRVSLPNPGRFARVTAVVVNSDIDQSGYDDGAGDYDWDSDDAAYSLTLGG